MEDVGAAGVPLSSSLFSICVSSTGKQGELSPATIGDFLMLIAATCSGLFNCVSCVPPVVVTNSPSSEGRPWDCEMFPTSEGGLVEVIATSEWEPAREGLPRTCGLHSAGLSISGGHDECSKCSI